MADELDTQGSVLQGNDRHAAIARWIRAFRSKRHKEGKEPSRLVLLCWCGDDTPRIVGTWDYEDVTEQMGFEISKLIDDYADNVGQHCKARLEFRTDAEIELIGKDFRGICRTANRLGQTSTYDGSSSSYLQQNQKHIEAVVETNVGLCKLLQADRGMVLEHARLLIDANKRETDERVARLEAERDAALERAAQAEELLERAVSAAEENAKAAEDAAGKDDDRVGTFLQLVQNGPQGGPGAVTK